MKDRILWLLFLLHGLAGSAYAQAVPAGNDAVLLCAEAKALSGAAERVAKGPTYRASHASPGFDATYYDLELDVDRSRTPILKGVVTITGRTSRTLDVLDLDLSDNMQVLSVTDVAGDPLAYAHASNTLSTTLAGPAEAGDFLAIRVAYEGEPQNTGFGTFEEGTVSGNPFVWTLSEPYGAREWWPNVDHPSDKADSVRVSVRVPVPQRVGSNGLLVGEADNGDGTTTYTWVHHYPISSYLVMIAVGVYDVYEQTYHRPAELASEFGPLSLPILHYAYAGTSQFQGIGGAYGWYKVTEILPLFEDWFGPYPFSEEKYGHANTTFGGGMEHQTMTSLGGNGWGLVAHELAHMWYGDKVTNKTWPHLWLHEGFATMAELLFWGSDKIGSSATYTSIFNLYYNRALDAEGTLVLQDTSSVGSMFAHARVYSKGGMLLHMLRRWVGDDTFRSILRAYAADPAVAYGTAETADFERVAEEVSGLDLSTFFRQWATEGTGYPKYSARWLPTATETGPAVRIELNQTQTTAESNRAVFEMPVDVVVYGKTGSQTFRVTNNRRSQTYELELDEQPTRIEVDPERSILRDPELPISRLPGPTVFDWAAYPNPASNFIRVRFDLIEPTNVTLRLFDAAGRLVRRYSYGHFDAGAFLRTLALPGDLASGLYAVQLRTEDRTESEMIAVVR